MRILILSLVVLFASACTADKAAQKRDARLVEIHTQLAAGYMQRDQLDIALQELDKALDIDSEDAQANSVMALVQARLKNPEKADKYFRRAVASEPNNSEVQNNYGAFLCEQGRLDEAVERFNKALANRLYKTPELANLNAGLCLMKKPAAAAASRYFKAALEINPRFAPALLEMSKINLNSGQTLSARGYMQRYFEVAKESPETLWLAIRIERALGNKDLQAKYALHLTGNFPDSPEAVQYKKLQAGSK